MIASLKKVNIYELHVSRWMFTILNPCDKTSMDSHEAVNALVYPCK